MRSRQISLIWNVTVLLLFLIGNVLVILSIAAELLGLDLTPGFGIVQMLQLLIGITLLTLAGFIHIYGLRDPNAPRSLQADIGIRLAATGLVFAYIAGLSDLMGIGTHLEPAFERPYVGPLQLGGLIVGIVTITLGMILYHTSRGSRHTSSLQFLLSESEREAVRAEAASAEAQAADDGEAAGAVTAPAEGTGEDAAIAEYVENENGAGSMTGGDALSANQSTQKAGPVE